MRYILSFIFIVIAIIPYSTLAYSDTTMSVEPNPPQPGDDITVTLNNFATNLEAHIISWYINGALFKKASGLTQIQLKLPTKGQTTIEAIIKGVSDTSINIDPVNVDLLWEADTTTPKWYRGRALPSDFSKIKAVAYVHDKNADTLIYNWYRDGTFLSHLSGVGKNYISINSPELFGSYILTVEVSDRNGVILGRGGATIKSVSPEVQFYYKLPLLGLFYNTTVSNSTYMLKGEDSVVAVPFYFNKEAINHLLYKWSVRGAKTRQTSANSITFRKIISTPSLTATIQNPDALIQSATASVTIKSDGNQNAIEQEQAVDSPFGTSK